MKLHCLHSVEDLDDAVSAYYIEYSVVPEMGYVPCISHIIVCKECAMQGLEEKRYFSINDCMNELHRIMKED